MFGANGDRMQNSSKTLLAPEPLRVRGSYFKSSPSTLLQCTLDKMDLFLLVTAPNTICFSLGLQMDLYDIKVRKMFEEFGLMKPSKMDAFADKFNLISKWLKHLNTFLSVL